MLHAFQTGTAIPVPTQVDRPSLFSKINLPSKEVSLAPTWNWRLDCPEVQFGLGAGGVTSNWAVTNWARDWDCLQELGQLSRGHGQGEHSPRKDAPTITTFLLVASFTTRLASSGVRMLKTFSTSLPLQLRALGLKNTHRG